MSQAPTLGWPLVWGLLVLLALAVSASRLARLGVGREVTTSALRAVVQLLAVAAVIAFVLDRLWASLLFVGLMLLTATVTGAGRVEARRDWPWVATALLGGAVPVLLVIFGLRVAELTGTVVIPVAGIIIGGSMTAHTLTGRRAFAALRADSGLVEASLALGFDRSTAILSVISPHAPEALTPIFDQTRTVGLVTLPGAFVGVILGGGSPSQAAATQVLVLIGLLAAETIVVVMTQRLIAHGKIMPGDVRSLLPTG